MDKFSIGKLLPNIEVSVEEPDVVAGCSSVKEDYVPSAYNVDVIHRNIESLHNPKIYKNKDGGFATGLDLLSEEQSGKLEKRAKRFGLEQGPPKATVASLYKSMNICLENRNSSKMKHIRLDAIHIRGVNKLTTEEVFAYFQEYSPNFLEWINDSSCNVLWYDEISCARAIIGLSEPLPDSLNHLPEKLKDTSFVQQTDDAPDISLLELNEDEKMEVDDAEETTSIHKCVDIPVPPGFWRLAVPHPKAKTILLRFATTADKKIPGAEKRSEFYKEHGNPNYGGLKGLISSSKKHKVQVAANKRAVQDVQNPSSSKVQDINVPKISRQKPIRMRMYADDEELRMKTKWEKQNNLEKKRNVHSRLGPKYTRDDLCRLGMNRDSDRDDVQDLRSKLKRLRSESRTGEHSRGNVRDQEREDYYDKKYSRIDTLKTESRSYYKRKHRSPLCVDCDDSKSSSDEDY